MWIGGWTTQGRPKKAAEGKVTLVGKGEIPTGRLISYELAFLPICSHIFHSHTPLLCLQLIDKEQSESSSVHKLPVESYHIYALKDRLPNLITFLIRGCPVKD